MPSERASVSPENTEGNAPQKRPRGRPKGSKNGPDVGSVGRPRKDGQAPKKRKLANGSALLLNSSSSSSPFEPIDETPSNSGAAAVASQSSSANRASHQGHCAHCGCDAANLGTANSHHGPNLPTHKDVTETVIETTQKDITTTIPSKVVSDSGGISNQEDIIPALQMTGMGDRRDLDVDTVASMPSTNGTSFNNLHNVWAPSRGIGLKDEYDDIGQEQDEEEDIEDIFEDSAGESEAADEFLPVDDDDESDLPSNSTEQSSSHRAPPPLPHKEKTTIPTWLAKHYADTRERLISETKKNPSRCPTCYVRHTFFDGCENPFFIANTKARLDPELFYQPLYFIWIPHLLIGRIPCPECLSKSRKGVNGNPVYLSPNGWPKMPRHVVDLFRCIFIIGQWYLCQNPECKKTYQSWCPSLLAALPPALAMQFNFHLTHRSGLTNTVISFMRLSFLQGIGPTPFANIIRANHLCHYENLHLQYLEMLYVHQNSPLLAAARYEPFSSFNDREGYAGCTPSGRYFRDFYVNFLSSHAPAMDQYTAMLSARILQIDHSFKVPKHLGKLNGVPVFTALHTGVNEFSEIRSLVMTPTKAHSQFMPALKAISTSLEIYSHDPIEAIFTDNPRGDRPELENAIPSLKKDVTPVPNLTMLEHLTIPANVTVLKLSSEFQVRTRFDSILKSLKNNEDSYVAVDMEWSVDRDSGLQSKVALISVTFGEEIFLIPLHLYIIVTAEVGVKVSGDLTRLFKDCGFVEGKDQAFAGALDLGRLVKEKGASLKATVGLADLCANVLQCYLPKDPEIRVSSAWTDTTLPASHENYAALDVYASWAVFKALSTVHVGGPVDSSTTGGTPVELLAADRSRIVAYGQIFPERPLKYQGISVSKTRVLVSITEVLVPGHLITKDLLPGDENLPLSAFQPTPFILLCKVKHLRVRVNNPFTHPQPKPTPPSAIEPQPHPATSQTLSNKQGYLERDLEEDGSVDDTDNTPWYTGMNDDLTTSEEAVLKHPNRDPVEHQCASVLNTSTTLTSAAHDNEPILRMRVSGDVFHGMKQFGISQTHGLCQPFAGALRDAIFQYDLEDCTNVKAFLSSKGVTWDYMLRTHSSWLLRRVRRFIPPPEELLPRVKKVLYEYGPLVDSTTHKPLFTDKTWEIAENFLENIRRGLYSDPVNVKLYYPSEKDKYGLLTYRCVRGTNSIEGGVHQNIIRWFGAFNAGPDFAVQLLHDYTLYHNLKVGYFNRTGKPYRGYESFMQ